MKIIKRFCILLLVGSLAACAVQSEPYDYTAFKESNPRSILVLMPTNETVDANAESGVWAQTTQPLAESGYYVFPAALAQATFFDNGMTHGNEIQKISLQKLRQIFGTDAVLYLNVEKYGTSYKVVESDTRVKISGKLLDAKTGKQLWEGTGEASDTEFREQSQGLVGALISAAINQIAHTVSDKSYDIAGIADHRMLKAGDNRDILYGPRSPQYWQNVQTGQ